MNNHYNKRTNPNPTNRYAYRKLLNLPKGFK